MCCIIPQMSTSFFCQLNIVAGFLVMLLLFTIYFTLRVINIFSDQCNMMALTMAEESQGKVMVETINQISLPLVECCDRHFVGAVWISVYVIMLILCIFVIISFFYLGDKVLMFAIGLFFIACIANIIFHIVVIYFSIRDETKNKLACYIENGILIDAYLYMILILNSYFFILDNQSRK